MRGGEPAHSRITLTKCQQGPRHHFSHRSRGIGCGSGSTCGVGESEIADDDVVAVEDAQQGGALGFLAGHLDQFALAVDRAGTIEDEAFGLVRKEQAAAIAGGQCLGRKRPGL